MYSVADGFDNKSHNNVTNRASMDGGSKKNTGTRQ